MKHLKRLITILFFIAISKSNIFCQCSVQDVIDTINYCPGQNAAWQVTNTGGAVYKWYRENTTTSGLDYISSGNYFETIDTYTSGFGKVKNYFYEKVFPQTVAPVLNNTTLPSSSANQPNSVTLPYTSSQNFNLNYVTVALNPNWSGNTGTFSINVSASGVTSDWYTFKLTDAIANNGSTFFFKVPLKVTGATEIGMSVPSGNSNIVISSCATGTCPSGSVPFQGTFSLFNSTTLNTSYALGTNMSLNYGTATNKVGIFDVDVTYTCGKKKVFASEETDATKCCTPLSANPTIVSTQISNIYDTIFPPNVKLTASGNPAHYFVWYKEGVQIAAGVGLVQIPITDYGYYDVKEVEDLKYVNRTACFELGSYNAIKKLLFAKVLPSKKVCLGDTAFLSAVGATSNFNWTTTSGIAINNSTAQIANVKPITTGTYIFTVKATLPNNNLVRNGDFEAGFTGFQTKYNYLDPAGATGSGPRKLLPFTNPAQGKFTINDYVFKPDWETWSNCKGRGGTGKFLYADGATQADQFLWKQNISVLAGKQYEFSAWFTNIYTESDNNNLPRPIIYIDGVPTSITMQKTTCLWQKVSTLWTAPTTGTITITVDELSRGNGGNDFAIDDIAFGTPGDQTDTVSINVVDCTTPLHFLTFEAENYNGTAKLSWSVVNAGNEGIYILEKSIDGHNYQKIGEVATTKSNVVYYDATFDNETKAYYRIKSVSGYSSVAVLYPNTEDNVLYVYPNPSNGGFNINLDQYNEVVSEILVLSLNGIIVEKIIKPTQLRLVVGQHLSKGIYTLVVKSDESVDNFKIIKE
jgi:hypothetical protein